MLATTILSFLNHVLTQEDWARGRLRAFAGQSARIELGGLGLPLEISDEGLFRVGATGNVPSVSIALPADTPVRLLTDRASVLTQAHVSGSAELAEALGFVLRNIRWDIESDLARLVGDIAAHRLVKSGKNLAAWQLGQTRNLAQNLAEFYTEEDPLIARRSEVSAFCQAVPEVQAELLRLEKRIASLESGKRSRQG